MCLASEAGKMDPVQSYPEDSSSQASLPQTTIKPKTEEEASDGVAAPPPFSSASPTSTDGDIQSAPVKDESEEKEGTPHDKGQAPCSAQETASERKRAKTNAESAAERVAQPRQSSTEAEAKPKKKLQRSSVAANSAAAKKKSKAKVTEAEKETEAHGALGSPAEAVTKEENKAASPETEKEEPRVEVPDFQGSAAQAQQPPCSPPPPSLRDDSQGKEACESSAESSGSRKSERRCKGALYKTLVSEGMLTSLRANIDRGISSGR